MRYILIIFFIFLFSLTVISCAKKSDSSSSTSANGSPGTYQLATNDYANGVATDSSGNVYVTGGTKGGLDGNTSAGNTDLFVVKYNSSGTKQWTKQLGSSGLDSANGIAIDSSGNLYVAGITYCKEWCGTNWLETKSLHTILYIISITLITVYTLTFFAPIPK